MQYKAIEWKKSPAHIRFLSRFNNPRSRKQESAADYLQQQLKEGVDHAIQRFVDEGVLVTPTLAEAINALHNKPPIEEMLRKHDLKASGNKPQIIERLIQHVPEAAQSMVGEHDLLICSESAKAFLDAYEQKRQKIEQLAKQKSFDALLRQDGKSAYKIYVEFHRHYGDMDMYGGGNYYAEEMEIVLTHKPELLDHLMERDAKYLRAASCMPLLWREEPALKWLPEDFVTKFEDGTVASNLLRKYAEIQHQISDADEEDKFKISFDTYDVDSCDICRKYDGQVLSVNEFPQLPSADCTSQKGCQFHVRHHWESRYNSSWDDDDLDDEGEDDFSGIRTGITLDFSKILDFESLEEVIAEKVEEFIKENVEVTLDPLSKLRTIKQMCDESLITTEEYEVVKQRILSKM